MTIDEAEYIYEQEYWELHQCDKMPWAIGWTYFDCVVNHSIHEATKWLQSAVGAVADGNLGPKTLAAIAAAKDPFAVARDITLTRRDYCEQLHNWDHFKAGWCKRQLNTLIGAIQWASSTLPVSAQ